MILSCFLPKTSEFRDGRTSKLIPSIHSIVKGRNRDAVTNGPADGSTYSNASGESERQDGPTKTYWQSDSRTEGPVNGRTHGGRDMRTEGRTNGRTHGRKDARTKRYADRRKRARKKGRKDGRKNGRTGTQTEGRPDGRGEDTTYIGIQIETITAANLSVAYIGSSLFNPRGFHPLSSRSPSPCFDSHGLSQL